MPNYAPGREDTCQAATGTFSGFLAAALTGLMDSEGSGFSIPCTSVILNLLSS